MLSSSTPIDITYLTNDSEGHVKIGQAMQQDMSRIGINLTVETREWAVFLNERKEGKFDFAREGWLTTMTRSTCLKCGKRHPATTTCSSEDNRSFCFMKKIK